MEDFAKFDPDTFEKICRDIVENIENIHLRKTAVGPDGGIDFSTASEKEKKKIIGQSKHYNDSTFPKLRKDVQTSAEGLAEREFDTYYLMTSYKLNKSNKQELKKLLETTLKANNINIYGRHELSDELDRCPQIKLHYITKLYDSIEVIKDVMNSNAGRKLAAHSYLSEEKLRKHIQLDVFPKVFRKLDNHKLIILTGEPGVGKTTFTEKLVQELVFKYSNNVDLEILEYAASDKEYEELEHNIKDRTIYILDDFLGKNALQFFTDKENAAIVRLIKTISSKHFRENYPNTYFILNSRINIIKSANIESSDFQKIDKNNENYKFFINLDEISDYNKAEILLSHIKHSDLSKEIKLLFREKNSLFSNTELYMWIIKHKNYNPRQIETIMDKLSGYKEFEKLKLIDEIKNYFENPFSLYESTFKRIDKDEKKLFLLYFVHYAKNETGIPLEEYIRLADQILSISKEVVENFINKYIGTFFQRENYDIKFLNPGIYEVIGELAKNNGPLYREVFKEYEKVESTNGNALKKFSEIVDEKIIKIEDTETYENISNKEKYRITKDINEKFKLLKAGLKEKDLPIDYIDDKKLEEKIFRECTLDEIIELFNVYSYIAYSDHSEIFIKTYEIGRQNLAELIETLIYSYLRRDTDRFDIVSAFLDDISDDVIDDDTLVPEIYDELKYRVETHTLENVNNNIIYSFSEYKNEEELSLFLQSCINESVSSYLDDEDYKDQIEEAIYNFYENNDYDDYPYRGKKDSSEDQKIHKLFTKESILSEY